ncbi:MAG: alpha/beta hydrolase [Eubacteriaceae bacterium]
MKANLYIDGIPAVLWGQPSNKVFIAIHGSQGSKDDRVISLFAEKAQQYGYQVLAFDLPGSGEREKTDGMGLRESMKDLQDVMDYAKKGWKSISLFAISIGAFFSLMSYRDSRLKQALFLSPIVDMQRMIENMMNWFHVSEDQLREEKKIATPMETLDWDYYDYVKKHPVDQWMVPTSILYGGNDEVVELDTIDAFSDRFKCSLDILDGGEHYFHTPAQLDRFQKWLEREIRR